MEIDRYKQRELVKENIEYENLWCELPYDDVEILLELIVAVKCRTASTIRIGDEVLPVNAVKQRFKQHDRRHITYIIETMRQTTTKINNVRAYLLTAMYNAPITIGPFSFFLSGQLNDISWSRVHINIMFQSSTNTYLPYWVLLAWR